jgi:hypothetical protein
MPSPPKVTELLDRAKLPTREKEVKAYRFRQRLHQAIGQARERLPRMSSESPAKAAASPSLTESEN